MSLLCEVCYWEVDMLDESWLPLESTGFFFDFEPFLFNCFFSEIDIPTDFLLMEAETLAV